MIRSKIGGDGSFDGRARQGRQLEIRLRHVHGSNGVPFLSSSLLHFAASCFHLESRYLVFNSNTWTGLFLVGSCSIPFPGTDQSINIDESGILGIAERQHMVALDLQTP
jgi:hypothetical protein